MLNNRLNNRVMKNLRKEDAPGIRVEPYPYIGIVKNNFDPNRVGRLEVWIPDLGGNPNDPENWRIVKYASPFMGSTDIETNSSNTKNAFTNTAHTYGMWMVPPDIGVEVICIFIGGQADRGYWFACTSSKIGRHMIPGIAGSTNVDPAFSDAENKSTYRPGQQVPVAEFNENNTDTNISPDYHSSKKPIHDPQYKILKSQGLDRDNVRGTVTSSSQRESPSNVFGISTPGRPYGAKDPANQDPNSFFEKVRKNMLKEDDYRVPTRTGGHTFIMDDGSIIGQDQLIRLRTAGGHQIMMHDSLETFYIAHSSGNSWIELTKSGAINIFSKTGFNVRSEGTINFRSESDIRMHAAKNIFMRAENKFQIDTGSYNLLAGGGISLQSGQTTSIKSKAEFLLDAASLISIQAGGKIALQGSSVTQQSGGTKPVNDLKATPVYVLPNSVLSASGLYEPTAKIETIATVAPTHEPYLRETKVYQKYSDSPEANQPIEPQPASPGSVDATKNLPPAPVKTPVTEKDIRNQPPAGCEIGNLTKEQLTAFYAQLGKRESGGNYSEKNTIGFVGKYQFGWAALADLKFVSMGTGSNANLNNRSEVWLGKYGVNSLEDWYANTDAQEKAVCELAQLNYKRLCKNGVITADTPPEDVAGFLAVSHLLGAGGPPTQKYPKGSGCWAFKNSGIGSDAYGTNGAEYFQLGKHAVLVSAPKVSEIKNG